MGHKFRVLILSFIILFICINVFISCKKYNNGPSISFRSRTSRVANEWIVENYKINETDFTSFISGYMETFTKSGNYNYTWGKLNGNGSWEFRNHDNEILLIGNDKQSSRTLYILKLEEKSFWYYYMDNNDRHEFHLISN